MTEHAQSSPSKGVQHVKRIIGYHGMKGCKESHMAEGNLSVTFMSIV